MLIPLDSSLTLTNWWMITSYLMPIISQRPWNWKLNIQAKNLFILSYTLLSSHIRVTRGGLMNLRNRWESGYGPVLPRWLGCGLVLLFKPYKLSHLGQVVWSTRKATRGSTTFRNGTEHAKNSTQYGFGHQILRDGRPTRNLPPALPFRDACTTGTRARCSRTSPKGNMAATLFSKKFLKKKISYTKLVKKLQALTSDN